MSLTRRARELEPVVADVVADLEGLAAERLGEPAVAELKLALRDLLDLGA